jgi:hypothetical protein
MRRGGSEGEGVEGVKRMTGMFSNLRVLACTYDKI